VYLYCLFLAVAVNSSDPLLDCHRVPGKVVVENDMADLKIDPFSAGRRADQEKSAVRIPERLHRGDLIFQWAANDLCHTFLAIYFDQLLRQKFQRVTVLSKNYKPLLRFLAAQIADGTHQGIE